MQKSLCQNLARILFYDLKKDDLISLAKHLKLQVKKAMRKHQSIIVKNIVSLKVLEETVLETVETSDSELKKLQLQLEFKKLEMQERLEMEEKQRQEREQQRQFECEKEERERQERLEREEKEQQEQLEREKMELEHKLEMRKLELQVELGSDPSVEKSSAKFDVTKHIKFVLPFKRADVDKGFFVF